MHRSLVRSVVAVALCAGMLEPASPAVTAQGTGEAAVVGTLESYDARTRVLRIRTGQVSEAFTLAERATVKLGAQSVPESGIAGQAGRRVKVRYADRAGRKVVVTMMISRPPSPRSPSHAAAELSSSGLS